MAWTTPVTRATGYLVLASDWNNEHVGDLAYLHGDAGVVSLNATVALPISTVTQTGGGTKTPDASNGVAYYTVTDATAFTIANPSNNAGTTQTVAITVFNNSGGAMGAITWGNLYNFKTFPWVNPASFGVTTAVFMYIGGSGTWECVGMSSSGGLAAAAMSTPANPTGNTSATAKMMGLSSGATFITPRTSRLKVEVVGDFSQATAASTGTAHLRYGTGNGPANGAAVTGTVVGAAHQFNQGAGFLVPFAFNALITGLTPGTGVWVDLDLAGDGTHATNLTNLTMLAHDLL